jgi:hypothetical protein
MTIAACYVSNEGVVFGADSTTSVQVPGSPGNLHHFNYAQKIFQIGPRGTLGIVMWGLGGLGKEASHRTLIARFADQLDAWHPATVQQVAESWGAFFWQSYSAWPQRQQALARIQQLKSLPSRTPEEGKELSGLLAGLSGGFCLGGTVPGDRDPQAFEITYSADMTGPGQPRMIPVGNTNWWGPNMMARLIHGVDPALLNAIQDSPHWKGKVEDLVNLAKPHQLQQIALLPIREAIDWVYTSIYTTIQAMKFSHLAPVCGGPVEVAVITTDREFRWVCHKRLDSAIESGLPYVERSHRH